MRRIIGFHRAWLCERGFPGVFARADEDLDIARNLSWRVRGTNYFRVNLIPLRFYLRAREASGRELDAREVSNIHFERRHLVYIFISACYSAKWLRGSSHCAFHFACRICLLLRTEVDNEGETRSKKQRAKSLPRNGTLGNLAFYSGLSISSMTEKQQYRCFKTNILNFASPC